MSDNASNKELRELANHLAFGEFSNPEPAPLPEGLEVTPHLCEWIESNFHPTTAEFVTGAVRARSEFGIAKYGQPLRTGDGRDTTADAGQELADFLQYAHKFRLQNPSLAEVDRFLRVNRPLVLVVMQIMREIRDLGTKAIIEGNRG